MSSISERERQNREALFKLMADNPDLPIVPMVDTEIVVGNDFGRWMGSWGFARIDEYLIPKKDWEPVLFKSGNSMSDVLESYLTDEEFDALLNSEEQYKQVYDALPWVKAIIVEIDLPE